MFTLIRIAISLILIFLSTQVLAEEEECTREYIDAVHAKCNNAHATMVVLDRNIAAVAGSQGAEGINDGANTQMSAVGTELDNFPMIAEGCQAIASDCARKCSKYPEVCAQPKMQAAAMAMQIGSMQTAFARTKQTEEASEIQVAGNQKYMRFENQADHRMQVTIPVVPIGHMNHLTNAQALEALNKDGSNIKWKELPR